MLVFLILAIGLAAVNAEDFEECPEGVQDEKGRVRMQVPDVTRQSMPVYYGDDGWYFWVNTEGFWVTGRTLGPHGPNSNPPVFTSTHSGQLCLIGEVSWNYGTATYIPFIGTWTDHDKINCYNDHGAINIEPEPYSTTMTMNECKQVCISEPICTGIVRLRYDGEGEGVCNIRTDINIDNCDSSWRSNRWTTWTLRRTPGAECDDNAGLWGFNDKTITDVASQAACRDLCLTESEFLCRSIDYWASGYKCWLCTETKFTQPDAFRIDHATTTGIYSYCTMPETAECYQDTAPYCLTMHLDNCIDVTLADKCCKTCDGFVNPYV